MVWPPAHHDALEFVRNKREILVVEETRGIIESQFKKYFYDYPDHKPGRMIGKNDEGSQSLEPGPLGRRAVATSAGTDRCEAPRSYIPVFEPYNAGESICNRG